MRTSVRVFFLLLICWVGSSNLALSQKKEGDKYFDKSQYAEALKFYNQYPKIAKRDETLIRRAICHYHLGNASKCLFDLNLAERLGNQSEELFKYRALTFHALSKYEEAAEIYKKQLTLLKKDAPERQVLVEKIKQCGYARNFILKPAIGVANNLGDQINTVWDEERLVESVNFPSKIYFTSDRPVSHKEELVNDARKEESFLKTQDIYTSTFNQPVWSSVEIFDLLINSDKNEKLLDFSNNGKVVFFQSGSTAKDLWLLTNTITEENNEVRPSRFHSPISLIRGDRDLRVVNDSILVFSSKELSGFGGYDLYYMTRNALGSWSEPINFGPEINTSANELSPFLSRNAKKLYFSSDRVYGLGGYDVFSSDYDGQYWSYPSNMGAGVNSSMDDFDFVLSRLGNKAYLSSNRIGGNGGFDIYQLDFIEQEINNLSTIVDLSFFQFENDQSIDDIASKQLDLDELDEKSNDWDLQKQRAKEKEANEKAAKEQAEKVAREKERVLQEQIAQEKEARKQAEKEAAAKEKAMKEQLAKEKEANEKAAKELAEKEAREKERALKEQIAQEKEARKQAEKEAAAKEKAMKEQLAKEKEANEKAAKELVEKEAREKERALKEQIAQEKEARKQAEKEAAAKEKAMKEQLAKEKEANEKAAKELAEKEKAERELAAKEQELKDQLAEAKAAREQVEREAAAREESIRLQLEKEQAAKEKLEKELAAKEEAAKQEEIRKQIALEEASKKRIEEEQAARERAAREAVAKEKAEKEQAARDLAAKKQEELEQAARMEVAREYAAKEYAANQKAAKEKAEKERIAKDLEAKKQTALDESPQITPKPLVYDDPEFQVNLEMDAVTIPKKEIIIQPLYFNADEYLFSNHNQVILNRIVDAKEYDPELKVVVISHGLKEGENAFDLFFSAKRGEVIIEQFKTMGIKEENLKLIGVGSNYPLVKQMSQGKKVSLADKYNRRLDIIVYPSKNSKLSVFHKEPIVADYLRDYKFDTYMDASNGLSYRIKVKETKSILENTPLNTYDDLIIEKVGKKYRYTLGLFKTFKDCKKLYDALEQEGFKDMQILPYENNLLISKDRLPLRIETHNDLINFINYRLGK